MNRNRLLSAAPAAGALAAALLAGCSTASDADAGRIDPADAGIVAPAPEADERSDGGSDERPDDGGAASAPEAGGDPAARFLACATEAGFEGFLDERGNVWVVDDFAQQVLDLRLQASDQPFPAGLLDDPRPGHAHMFSQGDDGRGVVVPVSAAYFTQDPVAAAAWAYCEAAHPDFEQPGFVVDEGLQAERLAIVQQDALGFARRARDAGHHWVADPVPGSPFIVLPAGLTEAELRAALADALDPDTWVGFDSDADLDFAWREVIGEFAGAAQG